MIVHWDLKATHCGAHNHALSAARDRADRQCARWFGKSSNIDTAMVHNAQS